MIIEKIQIGLIKVGVLAVAGLLFKSSYIRKCLGCGSELDIEDYYYNNSCEYCGSSQRYDKEDYGNSNLIFKRSEKGVVKNGIKTAGCL